MVRQYSFSVPIILDKRWRLESTFRLLDAYNNSINPLKHRRAYGTLVSYGEHLYLLGGGDGSTCFGSVERFSRRTNRWEIVAPLQTARGSLGAQVGGPMHGESRGGLEGV
eukprot:114747-Pyramimonas_sp.AAC.1